MFVAEDLPDVALAVPERLSPRGMQRQTARNPTRPSSRAYPDYTSVSPTLSSDACWIASGGRRLLTLLSEPRSLSGGGPLREAIAAHLAIWRGLDCSPDQVVITSGAADGFDLVARAIWRAEDEVIVETPRLHPDARRPDPRRHPRPRPRRR